MPAGIQAPTPDDDGDDTMDFRWDNYYGGFSGGIKSTGSSSSENDIYEYNEATTTAAKKKKSGGGGGGGISVDDLSGKDRDAAKALIALFKDYGLGSLANNIIEFLRDGYSADTIAIMLRETKEYKTRFKGNEIRRAAGMSVLSEAEYLATERSYLQVLRQAGLPKGFYDSYSDFTKFIANDMSAAELQERTTIATRFVTTERKDYIDALRRMYGLGIAEATAAALDPQRSLPLLQKQAAAVGIAAAAYQNDLGQTRGYAERLAELGITEEAALQGYSQVARMLPAFDELADIYGEDYSQRSAEREIFEGDAKATDKRRRLASQERGTFSGSSRGEVGRGKRKYDY